MRILLITSKPFLPQKDGGNVASGKLFSELSSAAVQITYCTLFSEKHPFVTEVFEKLRMNEVLAFPIRLKTYIFNAATTLLQGKSYVLKRFENKAFEKYLIENQKNFDLIIFDSLFSTLPLLNPKFTHSKIWLRSHNIEHQLWLDRKKKTKNL